MLFTVTVYGNGPDSKKKRLARGTVEAKDATEALAAAHKFLNDGTPALRSQVIETRVQAQTGSSLQWAKPREKKPAKK